MYFFSESQKLVIMELNQPKTDLLTFALYARDFDPEEVAPGKANTVTGTLLITFLSFLGFYILI